MKQAINIYTNPSDNNVLTINLSKIPDKKSCVDIYNKSGDFIKRIKLVEQITSVETESLPPGLYLLIFILGRKIRAVRYIKE
jgi:hypothetical protein